MSCKLQLVLQLAFVSALSVRSGDPLDRKPNRNSLISAAMMARSGNIDFDSGACASLLAFLFLDRKRLLLSGIPLKGKCRLMARYGINAKLILTEEPKSTTKRGGIRILCYKRIVLVT